MSGHALLRCTVYTVIAVVATSACGERTGPSEPTLARLETSPAAAKSESQAKIVKRSKALKGDLLATTTVTPGGGTLAIPDAGLLVVFPRGAVSKNLVVTVKAHSGKDIVYSFEPHGTRFSQPIAISQLLSLTTYAKKAGETQPDLHGGYLPNGLSDVDALGVGTFSESFPAAYGVRGTDTYVVFATTHFSGYALASGMFRIVVDFPFRLPDFDR